MRMAGCVEPPAVIHVCCLEHANTMRCTCCPVQEGHLDRQLALLQPVAALQGSAAAASALGLAASQVTGGAIWRAQQRQMESLSDAMVQSMQAASEQLAALAAGAAPPLEPEQ